VKVAGQWRYIYRAIDQFGQVVDVFVSRQREALLRLVSPRHAELATAAWRQITNASSSNATATRRATGSSTANS
jgi:hypothetical protein